MAKAQPKTQKSTTNDVVFFTEEEVELTRQIFAQCQIPLVADNAAALSVKARFILQKMSDLVQPGSDIPPTQAE